MNLFAYAHSDPSVGIPFRSWAVEGLGALDDYPEQREEVRQAFANAFALLTGEPVRVAFSDEHSDD